MAARYCSLPGSLSGPTNFYRKRESAGELGLLRRCSGHEIANQSGAWQDRSVALHVDAVLGVADQLKDGHKSYDVVARACEAHPPSVYRLLRALVAVGVFNETGNKEFSLTPLGMFLTTDAPGSRRNYAQWIGTSGQWRSWGNLLHSIKSGQSAAEFTHGKDAWTDRRQHPEEQAVFNSAMTSNSRSEAQAVLEAYDFSRFGHVVDVGGGQGLLLKEILLACPAARCIRFAIMPSPGLCRVACGLRWQRAG